MSAAEDRYLHELAWHQRRPPERNQRPVRLPLLKDDAYPHYVLDELADGTQVIAQVHTPPALIRGRVIAVDIDREQGEHVVHVGLALAGAASWPLLWRIDASRIEYEREFRMLTTPIWHGVDAFTAGLARLWRGSERLHVHLLSRWHADDERLRLLRRGKRVEVYGPVATLASLTPGAGTCEPLFSEVDPPECWCIHPLSITPA